MGPWFRGEESRKVGVWSGEGRGCGKEGDVPRDGDWEWEMGWPGLVEAVVRHGELQGM